MVVDYLSLRLKHGNNIWRKFWSKPEPRPLSIFTPEPWQCITHLKLMRAFARLRSEVMSLTVQELHIETAHAKISDSEQDRGETLLQDLAWKSYLEQAAYRFELWWTAMAAKDEHGNMIQINLSTCLQPGKLREMLEKTKPMAWTKNNLPPLDVLMILHSFMLNPRCFLEDCIRYNMLSLWKSGMPWDVLDEVIDISESSYTIPTSAKKLWEKTIGCRWNILQGGQGRKISCPFCDSLITYQPPMSSFSEPNGSIKSFNQPSTVACPKCNATLSKDILYVAKFRRALERLHENDVPLPGTILNFDGLVESFSKPGVEPDLFRLNNFMRSRIRMGQLFHMTSFERLKSDTPPTLHDLKRFVEHDLNPGTEQYLNPAIRRLFLQCSDTFSPFALDLAAAVVRQGTFIAQMQEIDWLHSPALEYTIDDLLHRYEVFFKIMEQNKKNVAVPTFAVDLAWHTHQLIPASYYTYSLANAGNVFIDHDDRIEDDIRTDAFDWTCDQYKILTDGKEYSQCLCWLCATACAYTKDSPELHALQFGEHGHVELEPGSNLEKLVFSKIATHQYERLEEDYAMACDDARKNGRQEPERKRFLEDYSWLYPRARPLLNT